MIHYGNQHVDNDEKKYVIMLVKEKSLHKLSQLEEYKKYKIIKIDKFEAKLSEN